MTHQGIVYAVAFSPDGTTVLTGSGDRTGPPSSGTRRPAGPCGHPCRIKASSARVAFSPDGKTVLTGCADEDGRLWDASPAGNSANPSTHRSCPYVSPMAVAYQPRRQDHPDRVVTLDVPARLWDRRRDAGLRSPLAASTASTPQRSGRWRSAPTARTVITQGMTAARLWDVATGQPVGRP